MTGSARIVRGNALALPLGDSIVDLIVTSPPYFGLRSYQDGGEHYDGQLGSEATPAEFVDALIAATREMVRVVKPSGSIWVNLGDKYAGGGGTWAKAEGGDLYARPGQVGTGGKSWGHRPKTLMGIPWRYALRCIDDLGLILRAEVIWSKPNGLPESVTDRVRRSHEDWFHFTLNPRYYSAVDEIREAHKYPNDQRHLRQAGGDYAPDASGHINGGLNPLGKLPGSVWTIPTEPLRVPDHLGIDHFAAFPTEWPRRIITGWSPRGVCVECGEGRRPVVERESHAAAFRDLPLNPGDVGRAVSQGSGENAEKHAKRMGLNRPGWRKNLPEPPTITGEACDCPEPTAPTTPGVVLDPFGGTGTTALVADALGRHGISVDMSADYCRLAEWRTTDPDQIARAMQVDKPARQVDGQADLFDYLEETP